MNKQQKGYKEKSPTKERYTVVLDGSGKATFDKGHHGAGVTVGQQGAWYYIGFIGDIGFTIALPIAGGALVGTYIDRQWSTYPKATLSFLFIGIIISFAGFIRTIREVMYKRRSH